MKALNCSARQGFGHVLLTLLLLAASPQVRAKMRSFGRTAIVVVAATISCQVANAAASFYSQCYKLVPVANEFAKECQQQARPFSRTFYPSGGSRGEVEAYSAYFRKLDAASNFVLGCVLNFKHKISFVGLYYSASPLDMANFDDLPIVFVDPDDNVAVRIDGQQHTLVAVRQFVTEEIPPRLTGRPKNCEDPHIEVASGAAVAAFVHLRRIDESRMEYCTGDYCKTAKYRTLEGVHDSPVIYTFYDLLFIDSNGVLMLKDDFFKNACAWPRDATNVYNIVHEMCAKAN